VRKAATIAAFFWPGIAYQRISAPLVQTLLNFTEDFDCGLRGCPLNLRRPITSPKDSYDLNDSTSA
jgi:hypothetical protein